MQQPYILTIVEDPTVDSLLCSSMDVLTKRVRDFICDRFENQDEKIKEFESSLKELDPQFTGYCSIGIGLYTTFHIFNLLYSEESISEMLEITENIKESGLCKCHVCGELLREDDEAYTDIENGKALCEAHAMFSEAIDAYYNSERKELEVIDNLQRNGGDKRHKRRRAVRVVLENGNHWDTDINGSIKDIEEYFYIGKNICTSGPEDKTDTYSKIKELYFIQ